MSHTGYGLTLAGVSLGSLTGIKKITGGGLELQMDEIKTVSDLNRVGMSIPVGAKGKPLQITFDWNKTVYSTLHAATLARTKDTFTLTDDESSTDVGAGYVNDPGERSLGTDGHEEFTATLTPETYWAFTPGA